MRPYLLAIAWVLCTSVYSSPSAPPSPSSSRATAVKQTLHQNEGYQCGRRVLMKHIIDQSTEQANNRAREETTSGDHQLDLSLFKVYEGPLTFQSSGRLLLWPIIFLKEYAQDTAFYFLVMTIQDNQRLETVGVMRHNGNSEMKCTKESDVSDVLGNDFASGYRCPREVFKFDLLAKVLEAARTHYECNFKNRGKDQYPMPYDAAPLFNLVGQFWLWPFTPHSVHHINAFSSIIMDENLDLIGVIYRVDNRYVRCKPTVFNSIVPKFTGEALEKHRHRINSDSVDVFQCGLDYVEAREVLKSTHLSVHGFYIKRKKPGALYPSPFTHELPTPQASVPLFIWPVYPDPKIKNKDRYPIYAQFEKVFFAVIDDFSDVHSFVMKTQTGSGYKECERKTVESNKYNGYMKQYLTKPRPVKKVRLST